jgi:hypothetical protein
MEAKIAQLESSESKAMVKLTNTKQELDKRIDDIQKSIGESFKSFFESTHSIRISS